MYVINMAASMFWFSFILVMLVDCVGSVLPPGFQCDVTTVLRESISVSATARREKDRKKKTCVSDDDKTKTAWAIIIFVVV